MLHLSHDLKLQENNKKFFKIDLLESSLENSCNKITEMEHHPNAGAAYNFLKPLIKYGQFSTAFPYSIRCSLNGKRLEYFTRRLRYWGVREFLFI
jgi:hypothetical protein